MSMSLYRLGLICIVALILIDTTSAYYRLYKTTVEFRDRPRQISPSIKEPSIRIFADGRGKKLTAYAIEGKLVVNGNHTYTRKLRDNAIFPNVDFSFVENNHLYVTLELYPETVREIQTHSLSLQVCWKLMITYMQILE